MLGVGRSRLAAGNALSLPKLSAIIARAIARSGPLSSGVANTVSNQATVVPFVKANLPLITTIVLREYATATKKKKTTTTTKKKPATKKKTTTIKKKRTVAKKTGTRRAATKKKTTAKKKKVAPKKKVIKKKKKVVAKKPGIRTDYKASKSNEEPKRTITAYALFFADHRKTASPGTLTERAKACSEKWHSLTENEKKVWTDLAQEERARRQAAHAEWLAKQNPADIMAANRARGRLSHYRDEKKMKGSKSVTKLKDARLVKRPLSAFVYFFKDTHSRADLQDLPDRRQVMVKVGELWRAISAAEKKKYTDLAAKDLVRYNTEKAEFQKKYVK